MANEEFVLQLDGASDIFGAVGLHLSLIHI